MKKTTSKQKPSAIWNQILYFKVYKESISDQNPTIKLFNNTRQQCPVTIAIVAMNGQNPVVLTPEQLASIELIDYVTNTPIPRSDAVGAGHQDWQYTIHRRDYEWDESLIPGPTDRETRTAEPSETRKAPHQGAQTIVFFVSSKVDMLKRIAARIRVPSSSAYVQTNYFDVPNDDGFGDGTGRFNSSVSVRPTAFPVLQPTDYGVFDTNNRLLPHTVGNTNIFFWAREHYLHVNFNNRLLRLKSVSATSNGSSGIGMYKQGGLLADVRWAISYYSQPGQRTVENFPLPPLNHLQVNNSRYSPNQMLQDCGAASLVGASSSRIVIGLLMGNVGGEFRSVSGGTVTDKPTTAVYILDVYGNEHALSLSLGNLVNQITVTTLLERI